MNILQISRQFYPATGGIESVTLGLSRALRERGHRCEVVTLREIYTTGERAPPSSQLDGLHIHRLPHLGTRRYPVAPAAANFLAPFDIVHIHAIDFFLDFFVVLRAIQQHQQHKPPMPLVVNTHGGIFHTRWLLPLKKAWFHTLTAFSLRRTDAVICDSQHDYRLFRSIVPPHLLHIVQNGVDVRPFERVEKQVEPGLLLGIGRIFENKRVERLIDLLPRLVADMPRARLVWIGIDQQGNIPALLARAEQLGVRQRVEFVGLIEQEEMLRWLARAHLFVSASAYEAFGISTIEAMSSATVPVVTPVGIHPDVVQDGENGFLYTFEGDQAAECLRHALTLEGPRLEQMGQRARAAAARYAWDTVVEDYLAIYRQVVRGAE